MKESNDSWYLVMRMQRWDSIELSPSIRLPLPFEVKQDDSPDQPIGFLPVFESIEAANKWANGDTIVLIGRAVLKNE